MNKTIWILLVVLILLPNISFGATNDEIIIQKIRILEELVEQLRDLLNQFKETQRSLEINIDMPKNKIVKEEEKGSISKDEKKESRKPLEQMTPEERDEFKRSAFIARP